MAAVERCGKKTWDYYDSKGAVRKDFLDRLPNNADGSILEIGCGTGRFGQQALAEGKCGRFCGVEVFEAAGEAARSRLSEVVVGDIEQLEIPWRQGEFDGLILSEVLEHLRNPSDLLKRMLKVLKPGGIVLASSPNVAHWRVLAMLARGRWDLTDKGVMDRTHLRWFTPVTFQNLFTSLGYDVKDCWSSSPMSWRASVLSRLSPIRIEHLCWRQIAVSAVVPKTYADGELLRQPWVGPGSASKKPT